MTDALDVLLESVREDEPSDEAFVQCVMAEVRKAEPRRSDRRWMHRPMVFGISAAIVVTGGAVAAVVGVNPGPDREPAAGGPAKTVAVSAAPKASSDERGAAVAPPAEGKQSPDQTKTPSGTGYASDHSSYVVDEKTGMLLRTETYTNAFTVSEEQRVTLTLENTGAHPVAFKSSRDCGLQVMAWGSDEDPSALRAGLRTDREGRFEWVCAGSDADPRAKSGSETWVLAPGERKVADAYLVLPQKGDWHVSGMCRCEYKQVKPTPVPKNDPIADLTTRALPSPLLEQPDGKNLVTPDIRVRAD